MSDQSLAERIAALIEAEKKPAQSEPELRPLAYTYKGAAKALGIGVSTITRDVRAGKLHVTRIRGRVLITDQELRRYLAENSDG